MSAKSFHKLWAPKTWTHTLTLHHQKDLTLLIWFRKQIAPKFVILVHKSSNRNRDPKFRLNHIEIEILNLIEIEHRSTVHVYVLTHVYRECLCCVWQAFVTDDTLTDLSTQILLGVNAIHSQGTWNCLGFQYISARYCSSLGCYDEHFVFHLRDLSSRS